MPAYSGIQYKILIRAPRPGAKVETKSVTDREWEASVQQQLDDYPFHKIFGRIHNLDVELFGAYDILRIELETLGYVVRKYDASKRLSIYPGIMHHERTAQQKLQDQMWLTLKENEGHIGYAVIGGTPSDCMLVGKLDREEYHPEELQPNTMTSMGGTYPVIGRVVDGAVTIFAPEKDIKKYLKVRPPHLMYKWFDRTAAAEKMREDTVEKERQIREHKREKCRKQKATKKGKDAEVDVDGKED